MKRINEHRRNRRTTVQRKTSRISAVFNPVIPLSYTYTYLNIRLIVTWQLLSTIQNRQRIIRFEFLDFTTTKQTKKIALYNEGTIETRSLTYRSFTSRGLLYQTRVQDFTEQNQHKNQILSAIFYLYSCFLHKEIKKLANKSRNRLRTTIIAWKLSNKKRSWNFYTDNTS
jgi:hypothetical protein